MNQQMCPWGQIYPLLNLNVLLYIYICCPIYITSTSSRMVYYVHNVLYAAE